MSRYKLLFDHDRLVVIDKIDDYEFQNLHISKMQLGQDRFNGDGVTLILTNEHNDIELKLQLGFHKGDVYAEVAKS